MRWPLYEVAGMVRFYCLVMYVNFKDTCQLFEKIPPKIWKSNTISFNLGKC